MAYVTKPPPIEHRDDEAPHSLVVAFVAEYTPMPAGQAAVLTAD